MKCRFHVKRNASWAALYRNRTMLLYDRRTSDLRMSSGMEVNSPEVPLLLSVVVGTPAVAWTRVPSLLPWHPTPPRILSVMPRYIAIPGPSQPADFGAGERRVLVQGMHFANVSTLRCRFGEGLEAHYS